MVFLSVWHMGSAAYRDVLLSVCGGLSVKSCQSWARQEELSDLECAVIL